MENTAPNDKPTLHQLEEMRLEIEYRICTLSFNVMFYNELVEKFAAQKNQQMLNVIATQQRLSQKLAIRHNEKLAAIDHRIALLRSSN
jgi:hypothetical protein